MSQCLIKNSEYRTKLAQSGIPEPIFYSFANSFVAQHGRFPNLDELPNVDSSQHLTESLNMKDGVAKVSTILNTTQSESISEANIKLNKEYTDLEIEIMELMDEALVNINHRPSEYKVSESEKFEISNSINQGVVFNQIFDKLRRLYGINLIPITNKELTKQFPELNNVSAFVHNGQIYINTDLADIDAPIHEMTHILLGSIKYNNPELYNQLISVAESFPGIERLIHENPNRVYTDILEEAFVQETSRYLAGMLSEVGLLPKDILYELHYNFKRLLDSALMGQMSVKSINNPYMLSISELAARVNSQLLEDSTLSSLDFAALHRMLSNVKSELLESNELREEC